MIWTLPKVKKKLAEIRDKGFITIPTEMFRTDDGIVGQIIEREFGIAENNLSVGDLGEFELKGMRKHSFDSYTLSQNNYHWNDSKSNI